MAPIAGLACLVVAGCGGSSSSSPTRTSARASTTATTTVATTPAAKPKPKPKPDPGTLPQTNQLPSADTPAFHAAMSALWRGVQEGSLQAALPAYFPEAAYVQVKQIADPRGDYVDRLLGDFKADLLAAHALLGSDPAAARLVSVNVPEQYAHWVDPGACYNGVGYYEVPNARVVYNQGGQVKSFGIASMISWRGVWYVVHLGAVVPTTTGGEVDAPSSGVGVSAPSSTC